MEFYYKPSFIKDFNALEKSLQDEVVFKIELFKQIKNHKQLNVHKLHGRLKNFHSFSVNYKYRIVFERRGKNEIHFLEVGDHNLYI